MSQITLDKGYTVVGGVVNLATVGVANATAVFQVSNLAQQIGTKSFKPRKIRIMNNAAGNTTLMIGTGVAGTFVARMPAINVFNGLEGNWQEVDLPGVEFFADMTVYPVALVAGGSIDVQIEAEEIG